MSECLKFSQQRPTKPFKAIIFFIFCTASSWIIFEVSPCVTPQRRYFSIVKRYAAHPVNISSWAFSVFTCLIMFFSLAVRTFSSSQLSVQTMTPFSIVWGHFLWTPSQNTNGWQTHSSRCRGFHLKTESSSTTLPIISSRYWLKSVALYYIHLVLCDQIYEHKFIFVITTQLYSTHW